MDSFKFKTEIICHFNARLKEAFEALSDEVINMLKEIRLKADKPVMLFCGTDTLFINKAGKVTRRPCENTVTVSKRELNDIFLSVCEYSIHAFAEQISNGFITIKGGHRVGLCGTAVCENGKVKSVREVCSLNFRIARQLIGVSDEILYRCFADKLSSVLIVGMPSSGKTTLLKDMANGLGNARLGRYIKVSVIDERGEIASCYQGVPQNDVGISCDVYDGYPKCQGMSMAIRTMSPQVMICDEIGSDDDVKLILQSTNSGVYIIASAHAKSLDELKNRGLINALIENRVFDYAVILGDDKTPCTIKRIINLKEHNDEVSIGTYGGSRI